MAQTIPFQSDQYFSRSWKMLTRDKGWIKPILLLAVGSLVPILGFLVLMGYAFEWARLTAWGAETAPKQRNIQIGECLKSGGRAFVVTFIWGIPLGILTAVFGWLPPLPIIIGLVGTIVSAVAALRATIFQSITAGLQLNRIFEMVKHDWRGLARIAIGMLVIATIIGIVFGMVLTASMVAIVPTMGDVFYDIGYISSSTTITAQQAMDITMAFLRAFGPVGIVLGIIGTVLSTILSLVVTNAVGLWMLQFNVPAWGASEDPLPLPIAPVAPYGAAPASTVVPHEGAVSARVRTTGETAYEPVDISAAPVAQPAPQQPAPQQVYQTPSGDQIQPLVVPPTQTPAQAPAAEVGEIPVVPVASLGADAQQEEPAPAAPTRTPAIDDETAQAEAYAEAVAVVAREEGVAPEEIAKTKAAPKAATKKTTTRKTTTRKTTAKKSTAKKASADDEAAAPKKTTKKTTAAKKTTTARKTAAAKKSADDDVAPKKATTTRRATAKKSADAGEETVAKKTTTRKTAAKKTTTRATSAKKEDAPAAKKTTTRRTSTAKKDEAKKSAPAPKAPSTRARKTTRKKEEDAPEQE